MIQRIYIGILFILNLWFLTYAATRSQEVSYLCLLNSTDSSILHFTFRLIANNDTVIALQAYDASTDIPNPSGKKETCRSSKGKDTNDSPLELSITLDTDDSASVASQSTACGVREVITGTSYKFRIRSIGDLDLDTWTDAFYDCVCDKNNLLAAWRSTGPIFTSSLQTTLLQEIHIEAKLRLVNAESKLVKSSIELGTPSHLQLIFSSKVTNNQYDSSGTDFWVLLAKDSRDLTFYALSAALVRTYVTFWISPTEQLTSPVILDPNTETKLRVNSSVTDMAVRVRSTENMFLVVSDNVSQYTIHPRDSLDNMYTILAITNQSAVFIVATENSTSVNISSPIVLRVSGKQNVSGTSLTIAVGAFDVYKVVGNGDFTGTTISSNLPIAIYSSNPFTDENSEYVLEQLPGYAKLGTDFVVFPSNGTLKCVAVDPGVTTITIGNNGNSGDDIVKNVNFRETISLSVPSVVFTQVKSDKKILCLLHNIGDDCDDASTSLPPKQQWSSNYVFSVNVTNVNKYIIYVTIRNGSETNLSVNGEVLSGLKWISIQHVKSVTGDNLVSMNMVLPPDIQSPVKISHLSAVFMVVVVKENKDNTVTATIPPGLHRSNVYLKNDPSCTSTIGYQGDLVDNDCDGLVDEDADIYSGEDLFYTQTEYIVPIAVRPVNCIAKPNDVWDDNGIYRVLTQSSGCLQEGAMKNPFTPSKTFQTISYSTTFSTVYETGTFNMPRFENQPKVYFQCQLEFCFNSNDKTCTTEICKPSSNRQKREAAKPDSLINNNNDELHAVGTAMVKVTGIHIVACLRNTNYMVATVCLGGTLFVAVIITFGLYVKLKITYKTCKLINL